MPVEYDLKRLKVPVAVFMGGKDTVVDNEALQRVCVCVCSSRF